MDDFELGGIQFNESSGKERIEEDGKNPKFFLARAIQTHWSKKDYESALKDIDKAISICEDERQKLEKNSDIIKTDSRISKKYEDMGNIIRDGIDRKQKTYQKYEEEAEYQAITEEYNGHLDKVYEKYNQMVNISYVACNDKKVVEYQKEWVKKNKESLAGFELFRIRNGYKYSSLKEKNEAYKRVEAVWYLQPWVFLKFPKMKNESWATADQKSVKLCNISAALIFINLVLSGTIGRIAERYGRVFSVLSILLIIFSALFLQMFFAQVMRRKYYSVCSEIWFAAKCKHIGLECRNTDIIIDTVNQQRVIIIIQIIIMILSCVVAW